MTKYNERLDDVLENIAQKMEKSCEEYFEQTVLDSEYTESVEKTKDQAKQAITSLIKELVAEAKPGPDRYYSSDCLEGYNLAIKDFEQNLLKALEEV